MDNITLYLFDELGLYEGTEERNPMTRMPERFALEAPPALEDGQFAVWSGSSWQVVDEVPEMPASIEVPPQVTMRQARLALLGQVAPAIATLESPHRERAEIEWEFSSEVYRDRPLVAMLGPKLGLTAAELDQLFITAKGL